MRTNLTELLSRLVDHGLLQIVPSDVEPLQRFNALDRPAQSLFLRAPVLLPVLAVSLRLRGLRATQAALSSFLPGSIEHNIQSRASEDTTKDASEISRMVQAAARYG